MQLIHGNQVKQALSKVKPTRIAVAFVGSDWASYIDIANVKEIIISPTLGSNPRAIEQIVNQIEGGWEKVHFLNELHAKLYIGPDAVAVGSFNLTNNGLSGEALSEAGIVSEDQELLSSSRSLFSSLKKKAQREYPNIKTKQAQLTRLISIWNRASTSGLIHAEATAISEFTPQTNTAFYVSWTDGSEIEWDHSVMKKHASKVFSDLESSVTVDDLVLDGLSFAAKDKVKKDQWLLRWDTKSDGSPGTKGMKWIYIHDVIPLGAVNSEYTKVAVQWANMPPAKSKPFVLDANTKKAVVKVLQRPKYKAFVPHPNDESWYLNDTFPLFLDFIRDVRAEAGINSW